MNIVVCCKLAPDAGDIKVKSDGSISLEGVEWRIGGFDLQALEVGVRLVDAQGGKLMALSAGPRLASTSKLRKDLLSRGPNELLMVVDDALARADTAVTASVLAEAIRKLDGIDLVLCGEGSSDLYFQQTGLQVGERLGWPTINAISRIEVKGNSLLVERSLEDEIELLEVPLPAVISVTTDIAQPRLPGMKEILKASSKPFIEWSLDHLGFLDGLPIQVEVLSTQAPSHVQRKNIVLAGTPAETGAALVNMLIKEGLL